MFKEALRIRVRSLVQNFVDMDIFFRKEKSRKQRVKFLIVFSKLKWSKLAQSCPTLCDPMDCSLPGSSIHGILQARTLEWVAMPSSRGSSRPRDQTQVAGIKPKLRADSLLLAPPGKPVFRDKLTFNSFPLNINLESQPKIKREITS